MKYFQLKSITVLFAVACVALFSSTAWADEAEKECKRRRHEVHAYLMGKKLNTNNYDAVLATTRKDTMKLNGAPVRSKIANMAVSTGKAANMYHFETYPTAWVSLPYASGNLPDVEVQMTEHSGSGWGDETPDFLYCEYALAKSARGWSNFKPAHLLQTWSGGLLDNRPRRIPSNARKAFVALVMSDFKRSVELPDIRGEVDDREAIYASVELFGRGRDLTRRKKKVPAADVKKSAGTGSKPKAKTPEVSVPTKQLSPRVGTANKTPAQTKPVKLSPNVAKKRKKRKIKRLRKRAQRKNARKDKKGTKGTKGTKGLSDVVDKYEEVEAAVKDFGNSTCGKATGRCWKRVKKAVKKKNKACRAFRKCRQRCRSKKRGSKQACFNARDCGKLRGKAKRRCKKGCRKGARLVKSSCFTKTCGRRPSACRQGWSGIGNALGQCAGSIKDTDCGSWAKRLVDATKKKDAEVQKEAEAATE